MSKKNVRTRHEDGRKGSSSDSSENAVNSLPQPSWRGGVGYGARTSAQCDEGNSFGGRYLTDHAVTFSGKIIITIIIIIIIMSQGG
jgi:hypothetical protein